MRKAETVVVQPAGGKFLLKRRDAGFQAVLAIGVAGLDLAKLAVESREQRAGQTGLRNDENGKRERLQT